MAQQPWITPQDVKDYTGYDEVAKRDDAKLLVDISRAEAYVISYTGETFADDTKYPEIPGAVRTAVILLAENYAFNSATSKGKYKSQTFDDYSYTVADGESSLVALDLGALLDSYIVAQTRGVTMKMRRL